MTKWLVLTTLIPILISCSTVPAQLNNNIDQLRILSVRDYIDEAISLANQWHFEDAKLIQIQAHVLPYVGVGEPDILFTFESA